MDQEIGFRPNTRRRQHRRSSIMVGLVAGVCGVALGAGGTFVALGGRGSAEAPAHAATSPSAAATAGSSSSAKRPGPARLAQAQRWTYDGDAFTATAYRYRPLRSLVPPRRHGYVYAGVDAKVCANAVKSKTLATISWMPWTLDYADGTSIEPVSEWSSEWFSVPLYPGAERQVPVGRCVRGWILYEVRKGSKPAEVVYGPEGGTPVSWQLS